MFEFTGFPGEVVVLIDDLVVAREGVVIPYWHLRYSQDVEPDHTPVWFAQAVPIGVWPACLTLLPLGDVLPLGITVPLTSFEEQERRFASAFRKRQPEERTLPLPWRLPLPDEVDLAATLSKQPVPITGLPPKQHIAAIKPRLLELEQDRLDGIEAFEAWRDENYV